MSEDYDIIDGPCPKCGADYLHSRHCNNLFCEDGFIDESEYDPINFMPGELVEKCGECNGTGVELWCPSCGANLSGHHFPVDDNDTTDYEE